MQNKSYFIPYFSVNRPITIIMIFAIVTLWGLIALTRIPVELKPNSSFNNISIILNVRGGMPPQEIESSITLPLEDEMATISGLKSLQSTSKDSRAVIVLSFDQEKDMDIASLEVSERFEKIKNDLPKEIEKPVIAKYEQNDIPVLILTLESSKISLEDIRDYADLTLKPILQRIHGVANIEISGGRERKILVDVDEEKLIARNLSIHQVTDSIEQNNLNILAGGITSENKIFLVRTEALYKNLDEVKDTIVFSNSQENIIRVKDVAEVSYSYMETNNISRINKSPVVSLYIQKESQANTVRTCNNILEALNTIKKTLPHDVNFKVADNQAEFIEEVLDKVKSSLITGGMLAIIILFIFLRNIFSTLIIGISMPLCVISTIGGMYFLNISINVMTLSGLALGIGMLVDNSIVVLENIYSRLNEKCDFKSAIIKGTGELFLALLGSTVSTLIVFLPIIFVNPQTKLIYGGMAITICLALISSLIVSISLIPAIFSLKKNIKIDIKKKTEENYIIKKYNFLLFGALRYRYFLLGCIMILLLGSMLHLRFMEKDIVGSGDEKKFTIFIELQSGAKVDISDKIVKEVETKLSEFNEIESFSSRIEGWSSKIYVKLKKESDIDTLDAINRVRQEIKGIGEKEQAFIYTSSGKSIGGTELIIDLFGYDYSRLLEISSKLSDKMKAHGGFFDFKLRYKPGRPEMVIDVNKERAALLGFSVKDIADAAHAQIRGIRATKIFENGNEIETIIRLSEKNRNKLEEVMNTQLVNKFGNAINLAEIVNFHEALAPSEIWHKDKMRMIQISISTNKYSYSNAINVISKIIRKSINFPEDYYYKFGDDYIEMQKIYSNLQIAALVMILLVYMLLAGLFESYVQPLLIIITVPLSLIGVSIFLGFSIGKITVGVLMGIIMLGGIVVNNAIVLIDKYNQLKSEKHGEIQAIINSCTSRFRPIIMTTSTTVFGLIPLAFDSSPSASLWAPLGITVIGGLTVSTLLTLFVVPSLTMILKDIKDIFYRI